MNFQFPEALYFILPVMGVLLLLALYARGARRRAAAAFADRAMRERIVPAENPLRFWAKLLLWEAAAVLVLLALARPQWGEVPEEVRVKGSDLYVLIDVSRSMLARDVPPSRLERAKLDVSNLLSRLQGERVGLIAFAGRAAVKCPLTTDYSFFRVALSELGPQSVDRGGTAIGDAIRVALNVLPKTSDRDQAVLLITDGDDQDSEPLPAAALAAERHVTIFTVGLGDPNEGASVPDKEGENLKYEGKDVVSKMGDDLLRKIALETNGAYVPARTSAYDLGSLYEQNLAKLRGEYTKQQKRARMSERFEIPLLLAVLCLLFDLFVRPYDRRRDEEHEPDARANGGTRMKKNAVGAAAVLLICVASCARAGDAGGLAREGLKLYEKKEYASAGEKLSEAEKLYDKDSRDEAARASFDAGCAFQREGKFDSAREQYMKAAVAPSKILAARAQFNLGTLAADEAKKLAGAKPEDVAPEKRAELVEKLKTAVGNFRSALDLDPDYPGARNDVELIRQWIKFYANKWAELDRQKHRDSMNLLQYLDELSKTQRLLRMGSKALDENASADEFAELKRAQDELRDEIGPLKDKIEKEIGGTGQAQPGQPAAPKPNVDPKQIEAAVQKLKEWADESGKEMRSASESFASGQLSEGAAAQKKAVVPLERSWEALAAFSATLQRDYAEETGVVAVLKPDVLAAEKKEAERIEAEKKAAEEKKEKKEGDKKEPEKEEPEKKDEAPPKPVELTKDEFKEFVELQGDILRRTEMLKAKAEHELAELEKNAPQNPNAPPKDPKKEEEKKWLTLEDVQREEEAKKRAQTAPAPKGEKKEEGDTPDPEAVKKGLQKAIELAPQAADKMKAALGHLEKDERDAAGPDAVEARRILKEIIDAQPKQKNQDQKQDQKQQQQNKDQDQDKKDEQKKKDDDKKKDDEKKNQEKKDQEKKEQQAAKLSKDQAEEVLRKIQERELQRKKQKSDEKEAIYGRMRGVDKDW